ncbi:hypothetical protein N7456_005681 [Penicillium angulare]|uniref:Uncharacterized protein n=1 Tax=Penicillium angulare TaxID=116970 RepID=A0A9W9KKG8_9EURO|nr:hypothetical protein N7456_005681 [Penicillium angulare]
MHFFPFATPRKETECRESLTFKAELMDDQAEFETVTVDSVGDLLEWIEEDRETAWRMLTRTYNTLEQAYASKQAVEEENRQLRCAHQLLQAHYMSMPQDSIRSQLVSKLSAMEKEHQKLQHETTKLQDERQALINSWGIMAASAPAPAQPSHSVHSADIPDPPLFTNGATITFTDWKAAIIRKLEVNGDHYPTDLQKIWYVRSRCGTLPQLLIDRRSSSNPSFFQNAEGVLYFLGGIFISPDRYYMQRAASGYRG